MCVENKVYGIEEENIVRKKRSCVLMLFMVKVLGVRSENILWKRKLCSIIDHFSHFGLYVKFLVVKCQSLLLLRNLY